MKRPVKKGELSSAMSKNGENSWLANPSQSLSPWTWYILIFAHALYNKNKMLDVKEIISLCTF